MWNNCGSCSSRCAKKLRLTRRSEKTAFGGVGSGFSKLKLEKPSQASLRISKAVKASGL